MNKNGACAKPTAIRVFINLFFILLFGNKINPTKNKYRDLNNQAIPEPIITISNLGGSNSPTYCEKKLSIALWGIKPTKAVKIIIDIAKIFNEKMASASNLRIKLEQWCNHSCNKY